MYKHLLLMAAAFLLLTSNAVAQTDTDNSDQDVTEEQQAESTPKERLKTLQKEIAEINARSSKEMRKVRSEMQGEDQETVMATMMEMQKKMMEEIDGVGAKILEIAAQHEEDPETSFDAIQWTLTNSPNSKMHAIAGKLLVAHHVDNDQVPDLMGQIQMPSQAVHDLFENLIENGTVDKNRAVTSLAFVEFINRASGLADMFAGNKQIAETYPEVAAYVASMGSLEEDAMEKRYKSIAEQFGEVEYRESTIGELVAKRLKIIEIRKSIAIGKVAHDIEGPDIDGNEFKLSDYRGKVVMLDFWGDW